MNGGLTSLMMWMLNSGNDKKRAEEYDRRQKEAEARQERLILARDSVAQMRDAAKTADERKWQLDSETRKIGEKRDEEERAAATKQEHINYGLKTMKQNSGVPFEAWAPHEQEAVLALPGMTIENAALIIAKINAGASVTQVKADLAKLNAAAAKDANDERAALTTAPYVERIAQGEAANKIARLNLGDRSISDLVGPENMATVNPDMQGGFKWQKNPAFTKKGDDLASLLTKTDTMTGAQPKSNADANAALAGGIITPKMIDAIDSQGNVVPVTTKQYEKAATPPPVDDSIRPTIGGSFATVTPAPKAIRPAVTVPKGYEVYADRLQPQQLPQTEEERLATEELIKKEIMNRIRSGGNQPYRQPVGQW